MTAPLTPDKPREELDDLRDYIERSYQGAIECDPHSYSGAARIAFADYVMARFLSWHEREVQTAIDTAVEQAYLKHFSYVDWQFGDDEQLRVGDYINCNKQDHNGVDANSFDGKIVLHHENQLPVVLYNIEDGDEENSGEYTDLGGMFISGYDFTRLTPPPVEHKPQKEAES